jgi:hypothetical protein
MALHRQEDDRGTVDTVGPATDQAFGQDRQPNMENGRSRNGDALGRQNGREAERSATIRLVCVPLGASRFLASLSVLLQCVERCVIGVMMDSAVGVHVNLDIGGRNLLGYFIKAVGGGRAVPKCQGGRWCNNARNVGQRHKPRREAASVHTGQDSKHIVIALGSQGRDHTEHSMPAGPAFRKTQAAAAPQGK